MKTIAAVLFLVFAGLAVSAQTDDIKRFEFFIGYTHARAGVNFGASPQTAELYSERTGHNGFDASGGFNFARYFGIKGDVSGTYKNDRFSFTIPSGIQSNPTTTMIVDADASLYNFLGGVQIKDNASDTRLKPVAHALVGAAHRRNEIAGGGFVCIAIVPCPTSTKETAFAAAFGGGLDVRLNKHVAFRVLADYNPIKFDARTDHNFRFSTGFVF